MKTLRLDDFDPNAIKEPVLKSTLDHMPVIQQAKAGTAPAPTAPVPPVRVVPPVPLPAPKRVMKQRHPFDIYHDQYDALRALATEDRKQGGFGSMSAMVREALDTFIAERKKK
jgi:hypothetical protein